MQVNENERAGILQMLAVWLSFEVVLIQKKAVFQCCLSVSERQWSEGYSFLVKILVGTSVNRNVYQCREATLVCKYFLGLAVIVLALESCARVV